MRSLIIFEIEKMYAVFVVVLVEGIILHNNECENIEFI